jgi:hypothetical protein
MKRTFVVGDVHGSIERLIELLLKAGCMRETYPNSDMQIDWDGYKMNPGIEVVQVGDLGDFGQQDPTRDWMCYTFARALGITVLMGNHDAACFDTLSHSFRGYRTPSFQTLMVMRKVSPKLAVARSGYLITHAGLHPSYMPVEATPEELALVLSSAGQLPVVTDIGPPRGGFAKQGGILWRDDREDLYDVPQIYGHTSGMMRKHGRSYCIDVGNKTNGSLAGIWLDTQQIVAIGPDAKMHETPFPEDA